MLIFDPTLRVSATASWFFYPTWCGCDPPIWTPQFLLIVQQLGAPHTTVEVIQFSSPVVIGSGIANPNFFTSRQPSCWRVISVSSTTKRADRNLVERVMQSTMTRRKWLPRIFQTYWFCIPKQEMHFKNWLFCPPNSVADCMFSYSVKVEVHQ
jgi:hypothetical protein